MKKEVDRVDATPSKRTFLSIIADYDLKRSICELVDNALDVWVRGHRSRPIAVEITLDTVQQIISVEDDAGGLWIYTKSTWTRNALSVLPKSSSC